VHILKAALTVVGSSLRTARPLPRGYSKVNAQVNPPTQHYS
jgi:hypothetical protein